jgi:hypothetical protein
MKNKKIIIFISLFIIFVILIGFIFNYDYQKLITNDANTYLTKVQEILNPKDLSSADLEAYQGTLKEEYHHSDPHGGQGTTYYENIDYLLTPDLTNNVLNLEISNDNYNANMPINNPYLLTLFKLKNITTTDINNLLNIKLKSKALFKRTYTLDNEVINEVFNTYYTNCYIEANTSIFKLNSYVIYLDNDYLSIKDNKVSFYQDNNLKWTYTVSDNNANITFDENNNLSVTKNNDTYKYSIKLNGVPFYLSIINNHLLLNITYVAKQYNDFTIETNYTLTKVNDTNNNYVNNDDTYLSNFILYDYIKKIKTLVS